MASIIEAKTFSLASDLAISVSSDKRSCSCWRRNFCSSDDCRFLNVAASAFNSAMRAASFALAIETDEEALVSDELLRFDCCDRLVEDLEALREAI